MAIKILKEGKKVKDVYEGQCSRCGCEFEIPGEEAHERIDFVLASSVRDPELANLYARAGRPLPKSTLNCPSCNGRAELELRTEIDGEPPVRKES